jgi:SAM-dependent methyltransferase
MALSYLIDPPKFPHSNVLGLKGKVFGRHWHERRGNTVEDHYDRRYAQISWPSPAKLRDAWYREDREPEMWPKYMNWFMSASDLSTTQSGLGFEVRTHVAKLIAENPYRKPVLLEWGCGEGRAANDLAIATRGRALVYAYADLWDINWNEADGVKFLFFVKEHLAEYFRRVGRSVDFIFAYGSLNYLEGQELITHLRDLATIMRPGALLVMPGGRIRPELADVQDIFVVREAVHYAMGGPMVEGGRYNHYELILK